MSTPILILLLLILLILVLALIAGLLYLVWRLQEKDNKSNQPDARLIKTPNGKNVNLNTKVLIRFLDQADDAYIEAYQRSNIEYFLPFCTIPLAMDLNNRILYCNDKVFGTKDHRKRSWQILEIRDKALIVQKDVTFSRIKERGKKSFYDYADPIHEVWKIGYSPSRFQVLEVDG